MDGAFFPKNDYRLYLCHHGIKGQKWGVKHGPPYPIGSSPRKVFISGTSKIKLKDSGYYRKSLPKEITSKIDSYMKDNNHILIGDAPGIDTEVQKYLAKKGYRNVTVYTISEGKPRAYWDDGHLGWGIKNVKGTEQVDKDKAMSKDAHTGFAVILENGAEATRNNIKRMDADEKDVEVFSLTKDGRDHWVYSKKYDVPTDRLHNDYNLDNWGKDADNNALWITGFSGSGKSTIAKKIAKDNKESVIHLDCYMGRTDNKSESALDWIKDRNKGFNEYLDKHFSDWKSVKNRAFTRVNGKTNKKAMGKYFDKLEKALVNYSKSLYGKNKIIIEGVQIMDDTLFYKNKDFFKNKPVIVMDTDITRAYMSAINRDKINISDAIDSERIDWYSGMFNDMTYLNNIMNTKLKDI